MEYKYTVKQLYDMLEVIDVHDSLLEIKQEKIEQEIKRQQKR